MIFLETLLNHFCECPVKFLMRKLCVCGGRGGVIRESVVVRLSENENQYLQGKATFKMLSRAIQLYNLILLCSEGKLFSLLPPRHPPPRHTHIASLGTCIFTTIISPIVYTMCQCNCLYVWTSYTKLFQHSNCLRLQINRLGWFYSLENKNRAPTAPSPISTSLSHCYYYKYYYYYCILSSPCPLPYL